MAVSKRTRYEVLRRDNHTCRYCGASAPEVKLTVDHVTPVALGGTDDPSNLVAACADCNAGKASSAPDAPLVENVRAVDAAWADAMRRAAELRAAERAAEDAYCDAFLERSPGLRGDGEVRVSLVRLYRAGLPAEEMLDAESIAAAARHVDNYFAYFMSVAWNRLTALQETARRILATDSEVG